MKKPDELNYFFVNSKGDITNPTTREAYDLEKEEAEALHSIIETDCETIMIYIHGGLNTEDSAIKRAKEIRKKMEEKGEIHPIFINWRSGPFTSYGEHLFFHRKGEHWNIVGPLTFPFVLLNDFGRAIARSPKSVINTIITYSKTYNFKYTNSGRNAYDLEEQASQTNHFGSLTCQKDYRNVRSIFKDHLVSAGSHTIGFFGNILMDFIATGSWDVMKRRTELMFVKSRPENSDNYTDISSYTHLRKGGVNNFLKQLKIYLEKKDKKVILVGHSMGTMVANNMLTSNSEIKYDRIIFMGAAGTIRDFQMSVIPYLVKNIGTEFYNYMLHPLAENLESYIFGIGGTGSLLVQIDDIYERPVAENQRTLGRWENVMNGLNYFDVDNDGQNHETFVENDVVKDLKKRIHLRTIPFSEDNPTKHTEFDDVENMNSVNGFFWEESFHDGK